MKIHIVISTLLLIGASVACRPARAQALCADAADGASVPVATAKVLQSFPHDTHAFTQGLAISGGQLYEGTGWLGESNLRRVDLSSGEVQQQVDLPPDVFGEGIAVVGDRILELSWRSHVGFVYDRASFSLIGTFNYPSEGWGLTYDGSRLILSDGSDTLRFIDPDTFSEVGQIRVRAGGRPVAQLNELEYIDGAVYANVWQTDRIAVIDPSSGNVCTWIDLTGLNALPLSSRDDVLNGIAFDPDARRLFVTGKRWPTLFEIQVSMPGAESIRP
jgi:glutaminyl-peptide cyclotransferase